jgi:hypothetical protein
MIPESDPASAGTWSPITFDCALGGIGTFVPLTPITKLVFLLPTTKEPYREDCLEEAEQKRQERELKQLRRRAVKMGYTLCRFCKLRHRNRAGRCQGLPLM